MTATAFLDPPEGGLPPTETASILRTVAAMTETRRELPPVADPRSWPPAAAVLAHDAETDPRTAGWFVELCRASSSAELCAAVEYDKLRAKKGEEVDAASAAADGHIETAETAVDGFTAALSSLVSGYFPAGWMDEIDQPGWIDTLLTAPLPETSVETVDVEVVDSPAEPVESAA